MKNLMRIACWIFIAFSPATLSAQKGASYIIHLNEEVQEAYQDTLVIGLRDNNKVLFIGSDFDEMKKYTLADSLKMLFISDWEKAVAAGTLNPETQKVYYFIEQKGMRRLKAENPEYSENSVNVAYEMKRLKLGLARYEYRIYDMKTGYRIEFYLEDPSQLKQVLGNISINDALAYAQTNLKKDLKKNYKVELDAENNTYKMVSSTRGNSDALEVVPAFGIGILGNTIAPIGGYDIWLRLTDKYSVPSFKFGIGYTAFPFVKMVNQEIDKISLVNMYDAKFAMNMNEGRTKPFWLGLSAGMTTSNLDSYNKKLKFGLLYQGTSPFEFSFDAIILSNKKSVAGVTIRLPF
jgi:hypothetical protein